MNYVGAIVVVTGSELDKNALSKESLSKVVREL
jgi:hypothetical protein